MHGKGFGKVFKLCWNSSGYESGDFHEGEYTLGERGVSVLAGRERYFWRMVYSEANEEIVRFVR